jgi:hypothetical protein
MIAVGGLCSVLACGSPRAAVVERRIAPLFTLGAVVLMGPELGLIMLPAFLLQLAALRRPEMDFFSRNK